MGRRFMVSNRFKIIDKAEKTCATLNEHYAPKSAATVINAAGHGYQPLKYSLSPDGRRLVILGKRVDGEQREYLHFAW